MARMFTAKEARHCILETTKLMQQLDAVCALPNMLQEDVEEAAKSTVSALTMEILQQIPVEEVNREKRGFRTSLLRENGCTTLADLAAASVYSIASINGISDDSAYSIKSAVQTLAQQAAQGVRVRLSTDNKTKETTDLVKALSKLRKTEPLVEICQRFLSGNRNRIDNTILDLTPGTGAIKWFFTSSSRKLRAERAYTLLLTELESGVLSRIKKSLQEIDTIQQMTADAAWLDFESNSITIINLLEKIVPGILGADDPIYGLPEDLARQIQEECFFPEGLLCELRRYQEWGVKYILHQKRVLLGDEMGLGKTIQAIAAMVSLKNTGATHFAVVCPASVISNWCREIRKHSLLSVTKIHGQGRSAALADWVKSGGVAVTTYETTGYFKLDEAFRFSLLVVDEAHYIKNPEAQRTSNVKRIGLHADRMLFMTGTALENKVDEMISLIGILQPQVAVSVRHMLALSAAPQFREKISPVYYRRKREDVLTELPELTEVEEWCTLGRDEELAYEDAVLSKNYALARRVSWNIDDLSKSSKAERLLELVEEAETDGRKVIVFSFFLDTIRKVTQLLGDRCSNPINGSVPPHRRQEIIDAFDKAPAGSVLVAQIQSGGTGLNIQSASVVVICEPQFKPSIENQAISRAYRMGQTRSVLVYRLLCEDTVDEKISEILAQKQKIFDAFADESVAAQESLELDDKTFGNIIKDEIQRINQKR